MSNKIYFQLLHITSATVPGLTFSKYPAERKAVAVVRNVTDTLYHIKKTDKNVPNRVHI
jgi:hypothetical protein